jgi:hypothetical protein
MRADVSAAVADMQRRQLERARAAAEETLRQSKALLLVWEELLAGGRRVPPQPGVMCCWCAGALNGAPALARQGEDGAFTWAHESCTQGEAERYRGPYGSVEQVRAALGALGAQLTGGESVKELEAALLQARRSDATDVDWASKKPRKAAKQRECALVAGCVIQKGAKYREASLKSACETHVQALLAGKAGT